MTHEELRVRDISEAESLGTLPHTHCPVSWTRKTQNEYYKFVTALNLWKI